MDQEQKSKVLPQDSKRRLKRIVIVHLMIVGSFFAASFLWGNFG